MGQQIAGYTESSTQFGDRQVPVGQLVYQLEANRIAKSKEGPRPLRSPHSGKDY